MSSDIRATMCKPGSSLGRTLGRTLGRRAPAPLVVILLSALAAGCGESSNSPSAPASTPASVPASASVPAPQVNAGPTVVSLVTYDGSGEAVHPDMASTPPGWGTTTAHVVATPYPGGQSRFENPSYYDAFTPSLWLAPASGKNPLALPTSGAYLSDPDMLYDPDTRMLSVYYREVTGDSNRVILIRSKDGAHWSAPTTVLSVPRHLAVSPSIVRRSAGDWLMWVVNAGSDGCTSFETTVEVRHSTDGVAWGAPEQVRIGRPGEYAWHIDVEWIPSRHEYWAVYNAKTHNSCMTELVRFATSPDGVSWTDFPSPLIRAGAIPEFADVVYRASIAYDSLTDAVTVLYSGAREDSSKYTWQVASEQLDLRTLMARVSAPQPAASTHARMPETRVVHPLTNETAP